METEIEEIEVKRSLKGYKPTKRKRKNSLADDNTTDETPPNTPPTEDDYANEGNIWIEGDTDSPVPYTGDNTRNFGSSDRLGDQFLHDTQNGGTYPNAVNSSTDDVQPVNMPDDADRAVWDPNTGMYTFPTTDIVGHSNVPPISNGSGGGFGTPMWPNILGGAGGGFGNGQQPMQSGAGGDPGAKWWQMMGPGNPLQNQWAKPPVSSPANIAPPSQENLSNTTKIPGFFPNNLALDAKTLLLNQGYEITSSTSGGNLNMSTIKVSDLNGLFSPKYLTNYTTAIGEISSRNVDLTVEILNVAQAIQTIKAEIDPNNPNAIQFTITNNITIVKLNTGEVSSITQTVQTQILSTIPNVYQGDDWSGSIHIDYNASQPIINNLGTDLSNVSTDLENSANNAMQDNMLLIGESLFEKLQQQQEQNWEQLKRQNNMQ